MGRTLVCVELASLFILWHTAPPAYGLTVTVSQPQTSAPTTDKSAESTLEPTQAGNNHAGQLRHVREGLVDPAARPEERRRWADMLLSYETPQAKALTVELLGLAVNPNVQRTLCGVIAERARRTPQQLDPSLVPPLLDLLGAEAEDLRTTAAEALAEFPGGDVPLGLGQLASQDDVPLVKRLAAIDALAPNTHRRDVVAQLINLLNAGVPEVTKRVVAALEPATPGTMGLDLQRWRLWWEEKSQLSDEAWLAEQLQVYRDRSRRVADEFRTHRETTRQDREAVTGRVRDFQRELFRTLSPEQRAGKLAEWLEEPLPVVQLTALAIIKTQIADEGKRPEGRVLDALLRLLESGSPTLRREALEVVQNLTDPAVIEAVLAQLAKETDLPTRHAIFKAVGKLDNPAAIPSLIQEIAASDSSADCVREAAIALGRVAAKAEANGVLKDATVPLKGRYQLTGPEDVAMRAALLTAMAGLADEAFKPEFLDAVESDDATVLRPAIRGILKVAETSKLPRLRTLTGHTDPQVRLAAIEAVGRLGREDAELESLLARLNPTIENNELARDAAWRGFCEILGSRSKQARIDAAQHLRELPDLEIRYLTELADDLSTPNGEGGHLEAVLDRLAAVLSSEGHHGEAVEPLRRVYEMRIARSDSGGAECGRRLLEAALRRPANADVAGLITQLHTAAPDTAEQQAIVATVTAYLESQELTGDLEHARTLLDALRSVPPEIMGDGWTQRLDQLSADLQPDNNGPPSPPLPGN